MDLKEEELGEDLSRVKRFIADALRLNRFENDKDETDYSVQDSVWW